MKNPLATLFKFLHTGWGFLVFGAFILTSYFYARLKYWQKGRLAFFQLFSFYQRWSNLWLKLTGFTLKVEGLEYFHQQKKYIIVGNHSSVLDMFALASGIPNPFKTLAKKELERIPIVGMIFKAGCVHVDRSNPESRKTSLVEIKKELEMGYPILILPEGTRNKSIKPLNDFKDGAFRLAIETQTPILPAVILNVRTLMPYPQNIIQKTGIIKLVFLPPVNVKGLSETDINHLKIKVYSLIENELLSQDTFWVGRTQFPEQN